MNNSIRFDSLEALLYASMKYVGSKELEEYNSVSSDIAFSDKGKQRLIKRLMKEKEYIESHKTYRPAKEFFKRLAVAILLAITLLFTACMYLEPIREAIWEFVTEWYEDYISVDVVNVNDEQESYDNASTPTYIVPTEIVDYKEPVIPDGYERFVVVSNSNQYMLEYEKNDIVISYTQMLLSNYKSLISNNDTRLFDVIINGNDGVRTEFSSGNITVNTITWTDGHYCYQISGNESEEFILQLAKSIS